MGTSITSSGGITEVSPGVLNITYFFKGNDANIEGVDVCWNYWKSFKATASKNPELNAKIDSVDVTPFTGNSFNSTCDLPAGAVWVRVWARIKWKSYEVKQGNETVTKYYGGDSSTGIEGWYGYDQWVINDNSWPLKPPEPQYRMLNDYQMEVSVSDIRPASPDGLRYANDVAFQLWDETKAIETKYVRVWNGKKFEVDNYEPADPNKPPNDIAKTTARVVFTLKPGKQYYVRASSVRYGDGTNPPNGEMWYPYVSAGESAWTNWVPDGIEGVQIVPSAFKLESVKALSATSVRLDWEGDKSAKTYTIAYAEREEYLWSESNATTEITDIHSLDYIITGLESGKTYFFSVTGVNDSGQGRYSNILSIVLGRKPAAPTTWSSTTTASVGKQVYLYWKHNSEDNSIQQNAELSISVNGGTPEIHKFTTPNTSEDDQDKRPTSSFLLDTNKYRDGAVITWKVRTAGVLKESNGQPAYGPWSIEKAVEVFAPPSLAVRGDDIVTSFPYNIELEAGPKGQKVISFSLSISSKNKYNDFDPTGSEVYIGAGQEIFSFYYDPDPNNPYEDDSLKWDPTTMTLTVKLNPQNINLSGGQGYTVRANVSMSTGLSLDEDNTYDFRVSWKESMDGSLSGSSYINYDNLTAQITPFYYDKNGELDQNVTLSVFRRTFDGNYLELEKNVRNVGTPVVIDPHPPLDYANYRIVATSQITGAVMYKDLDPTFVHEIFAVIQWDESWPSYYQDYSGPGAVIQPEWQGTMLKLPWNLDVSDKWAPQTSAIEYIGREHPVGYYGTQVGSTSSWKLDVVKADREMIAKLRQLATYKGNVYVREPYGSGYWAMVKVSFSQNHTEVVVPVTIDITRVEGGV